MGRQLGVERLVEGRCGVCGGDEGLAAGEEEGRVEMREQGSREGGEGLEVEECEEVGEGDVEAGFGIGIGFGVGL